jgi:uncharacterized protein GlcG (DUF336 family)
MRFVFRENISVSVMLGSALVLSAAHAGAAAAGCKDLPSHAQLRTQLAAVVAEDNAGLGNGMWATIVDRDGIVCQVAFTGGDRGDQWPGSRVISAQKANTANAFSLPGDAGFGKALSSGNLYGTVLEQGSLFGLQFSNPVDPAVAYKGPPQKFGKSNDPMTGKPIGGVNVFGGGLALYSSGGALLGGLGVSGDTSCTDHIVAWKVRDGLGLDNIPGGVAPPAPDAPNGTDNLIIAPPVDPSTFEHPTCGPDADAIIANLPKEEEFPIGD